MDDPICQFFGEESVDLYAVLALSSDASAENIRKSYRKLALLCHPDKLPHATNEERANASAQFQRIGFAYAVLSDEKRRKKYDKTGRTGEGFLSDVDEDGGWEAYFETLFERVTRGRLDEMKKEYQGSAEEVEDLKAAYLETGGCFDKIMQRIPHATTDDETRFIVALSNIVQAGDLPSLSMWESSSKDEKAKLVRKKQGDKEAKEAEELAKELGVWDEFYGSGKTGARKGKGKAKKPADDEDGDEGDTSGLQALILKRQKERNGFLDHLAAKYADMEEPPKKNRGRGKKRNKNADQSEAEVESPKKPHIQEPDIDDAEFNQIQEKLFAAKRKSSGEGSAKGRRGGRGKTAK